MYKIIRNLIGFGSSCSRRVVLSADVNYSTQAWPELCFVSFLMFFFWGGGGAPCICMSSDVHSAFKNKSTKDYTVSQICAKTWNFLCFFNFYIILLSMLQNIVRLLAFLCLLAKCDTLTVDRFWAIFTFAGEVLLHLLALYTFAGVLRLLALYTQAPGRRGCWGCCSTPCKIFAMSFYINHWLIW